MGGLILLGIIMLVCLTILYWAMSRNANYE